ncbi:16S rRNA methyltransferase rsmB/F domain-containing protein [Ditylenchus destructor]|nr:16S rRNA methyltransferase rsmB/F domain-containing protein [Ditylenchus destructor]
MGKKRPVPIEAPSGSDGSEVENDVPSTDEEEMEVEKKSKKIIAKNKKIRKEADEEMRLNITSETGNGYGFRLPDEKEVEEELKDARNFEMVKERMQNIVQILNDFKNRREDGKKRGQYLNVFRKDLCTYYGYNEFLMEKFMALFPNGSELMEFLDANQQQRPVTIRSNPLKTRRGELARTLIGRGMNVDPASNWTKVGLIVYDSQVPVGATPEYLAGHYMLQGMSSFLPVMALAPKPGEKVLDMCAAPGGKTSHIAALMKNTGTIFANDANAYRCKAVIGNLHRMGVNNAIVSNVDAQLYAKMQPQAFDRILLDAPCSGTGVIWKDETVKTSKDHVDIKRKFTMQRRLLLSAIDALDARSKTGGFLVYSTCSVLVEENEAVVQHALEKRDVKLVPTELEIGLEGFAKFREYRFHPTMNLTRRYYPHVHNIDGFFVAKLQKMSNDGIKKQREEDDESDQEDDEVESES